MKLRVLDIRKTLNRWFFIELPDFCYIECNTGGICIKGLLFSVRIDYVKAGPDIVNGKYDPSFEIEVHFGPKGWGTWRQGHIKDDNIWVTYANKKRNIVDLLKMTEEK